MSGRVEIEEDERRAWEIMGIIGEREFEAIEHGRASTGARGRGCGGCWKRPSCPTGPAEVASSSPLPPRPAGLASAPLLLPSVLECRSVQSRNPVPAPEPTGGRNAGGRRAAGSKRNF